jgi:hypothetical protein
MDSFLHIPAGVGRPFEFLRGHELDAHGFLVVGDGLFKLEISCLSRSAYSTTAPAWSPDAPAHLASSGWGYLDRNAIQTRTFCGRARRGPLARLRD